MYIVHRCMRLIETQNQHPRIEEFDLINEKLY